MLLERFLNLIDNSKMIGNVIANKQALIESTDPDRIYVENIRSFFSVPHRVAKLLCEMAVKDRIFLKRYGYLCANEDCESLIFVSEKHIDTDDKIICETCELREKDTTKFNLKDLEEVTFYKLNQ